MRNFAEKVGVLYLGKIVETGDTARVFADPQHDYTQAASRLGAGDLGGGGGDAPGDPADRRGNPDCRETPRPAPKPGGLGKRPERGS